MAKGISPLKFSDYRVYLKEVINFIKEKNPAFSLRSLAIKLETPASYMSEVLNGKKNLSLEKTMKFAKLLQLNSAEIGHLCRLVALDSCEDSEIRNALLAEISATNANSLRAEIELKYFELISSWECIAIFELIHAYPKQPSKFFAKQLGIQEVTAASAIEKLKQTGFIEEQNSGFRRIKNDIFATSGSHNLAFKMYHSAMLEKARSAIYNQSPNRRFTGTETLMIDPKLLPQAHALINQCMDKIVQLLNQSSDKSSLVHLQVHLFELNNKKEDVS